MMKNKKALVMSVLCAIASVGFVMSASAEDVAHGNLDEVVVEGSRNQMPGEMVNAKGSVGLLGEKDVMKTPFSVTNVAQKTMDLFLGPNEPLDKALVGVPSVRASGSVLHGDFSVRGFRTNGTAMYVNGVHGVMTQFNLPMFAMEGIDVVSGPNSMLGAVVFNMNPILPVVLSMLEQNVPVIRTLLNINKHSPVKDPLVNIWISANVLEKNVNGVCV